MRMTVTVKVTVNTNSDTIKEATREAARAADELLACKDGVDYMVTNIETAEEPKTRVYDQNKAECVCGWTGFMNETRKHTKGPQSCPVCNSTNLSHPLLPKEQRVFVNTCRDIY